MNLAAVPTPRHRSAASPSPVPGLRRRSPSASPSGPAGRPADATDFYAGGRSFSGFQNGMAIGGDYMSAASFLGIAGIIALYGYDGFLYSIGFLVAWLVALLLVAELLRNSGQYTMADVLAFRMRQRPVRTAAAISTIVVSIFYLLAQMVGAGALVALLLGIKPAPSAGRRHRKIVDDRRRRRPDDHLRHRRRHEGHHLGPDRQGLPAHDGAVADDGPGAGELQVQPVRRCSATRPSKSGKGDAFLEPGLRYGKSRRQRRLTQDRLHLARHRAGARHRRPAAHPDPLLHRARRPRPPGAVGATGRSASSAPSTCSPWRSASARRRWSARRRSSPPNPAGNTAAPLLAQALGGSLRRRLGGASSWRSSRRSRSPRSSRWSPA